MGESGQIVETGYYLPWGGERGDQGITTTDYGYTGQMREGDIYYYNARWYDPAIGRFMQADTIVPMASQGTQAFDRYAYVNNNPLRYIDPSGNRFCDDYYGSGCAVFSPPSSPQMNYREAIGSYGYSLYGLSDFTENDMKTIHNSLLHLGRGLENLGVSDGKQWIKKNMGGMFMKGITIQTLPSLKGNNFVLFGKLIYLSDNFTANNWQTPKGTAASSLMHENWHVFSGFSTYLPGGRVGKLIGAVGAESSNLFQFTHNSLQIDDIYFLNIGDNGYGNTSPAD